MCRMYFGFCVLLRFCFLLRFWISPSRKSLLQIFPAWEYITYRQVLSIGITRFFEGQAPVVRRVDNTIHKIKLYLVDNAIRFTITH